MTRFPHHYLRYQPISFRLRQATYHSMAVNKDMTRRTTETLPSLPTTKQGSSCHRFVFLRHGESEFNNANVFTGWCDVALTQRGVVESIEAGQVFASHGLSFRKAYCSLLTRSIVTAQRSLEIAGLSYTPLKYDWRLNERHYGALQGLSKEKTAQRLGRELVMSWRRSYVARPPAMLPHHPHYDMIHQDPRYRHLTNIPTTESLEDCQKRVIQAWEDILEDTRKSVAIWSVKNNKQQEKKEVELESNYSLVVAHANTLRALVMHLDDINAHEIEGLNIPTAIPFYYDVNLETSEVVSPAGLEDGNRIGLGRFRGIYIADERKKQGFLERRRAANDPFRWALYDHQVDRNMLLSNKGDDTSARKTIPAAAEPAKGAVPSVEDQMQELEQEAKENTQLFSPYLQKQDSSMI